MPYVNVPNDLSKIKTKIAFNLTKRQLICFGMGAAIGVPTYLLTRQVIGNTGARVAMLAIMLPEVLVVRPMEPIEHSKNPEKRKHAPGAVRPADHSLYRHAPGRDLSNPRRALHKDAGI